MSTTTIELNAAVKAEAQQIVTEGTDIRSRMAKAVTQATAQAQEAGHGLVELIRAAVDGAREGLARSVPKDRDDVLRQVVDGLGDALSQTALAGKLAVQEAASSSRLYRTEDLARLRDDLSAIRELFTETVAKGLKSCQALTADQVSNAKKHAGRVADHLQPVFSQAIDAVGQHPFTLAREAVQAGVGAGQGAAGSLFQAVGQMLQRAGEEMRRQRESDK